MSRALRDRAKAIGNAEILPWQEAMPELGAGVRIDDWGDYIFHGILLFIVALALVHTVLMSVLHRTREFGVLRMREGMSFSGVFVEPVIVLEFRFAQVARSVIYVAIIGTLSSLYPAYYASRLGVAEALTVDQ